MSQRLLVWIGGVPVPSGFRLPSAVIPRPQAMTAAIPAAVSSSDAFHRARSPAGAGAPGGTSAPGGASDASVPLVSSRVVAQQREAAREQADCQDAEKSSIDAPVRSDPAVE